MRIQIEECNFIPMEINHPDLKCIWKSKEQNSFPLVKVILKPRENWKGYGMNMTNTDFHLIIWMNLLNGIIIGTWCIMVGNWREAKGSIHKKASS